MYSALFSSSTTVAGACFLLRAADSATPKSGSAFTKILGWPEGRAEASAEGGASGSEAACSLATTGTCGGMGGGGGIGGGAGCAAPEALSTMAETTLSLTPAVLR